MIIYKTTNLVNGKIYVGKDCNNNPKYLGSGILINKAIKKYGKENFKKEILEFCDLSNINDREIYWIRYFDARNQKVGYNIALGGEGLEKGHVFSDETRRRMSKNNADFTGDKSPCFGKPLAEETKKKLSEIMTGRKLSEEHKKKLQERKASEDTKRKMSESRKGKKFSEEDKKHISGAQKKIIALGIKRILRGKDNPMFGKKQSLETRLRMSQNHADFKGFKHPNFGKPMYEEQKLKLAIKALNRWAFKKIENKIKKVNRMAA